MAMLADELGLIDIFNELSKLVIIEKVLQHVYVHTMPPQNGKDGKEQILDTNDFIWIGSLYKRHDKPEESENHCIRTSPESDIPMGWDPLIRVR